MNNNDKRRSKMSNRMLNNVTYNCSDYFNTISENPQKIINLDTKLYNDILSNDFIVGDNTRNNNNIEDISSIDLTDHKFQFQYRNFQNPNIYNNTFMQGGINSRIININCNN